MSEFVRMLEENGVELKSKVQFSYFREVDGGLTKFISGDRFVYVAPFDPPLPRNQTVAKFPCTVSTMEKPRYANLVGKLVTSQGIIHSSTLCAQGIISL